MKLKEFLICTLFVLLVTGCMINDNSTPPIIKVTIITREVTQNVTRINNIYQTIIPTITPLPIYSLTPIPSCYDTAKSQIELTGCATSIALETKKELDELVKKIATKFSSGNPPKREEFLKLEIEWEILAENECILWWGSVTDYGWWENGSMAPQLVSECLSEKYKQRIEELQILL